MESGGDNNDGSDIFWPGYVDATTNLILNLLFLLTILIVAVFMFALELGRSSKIHVENPPIVATKPAEEVLFKPIADIDETISVKPPLTSTEEVDEVLSESTSDVVKENVVLKREIQRLNEMLAMRDSPKVHTGGLEKTSDATLSLPKPIEGLDKTHADDFEITVSFKDEAISLTPEEREQLIETLKPVVKRGKSNIYVEVPAGFSEAKRLGFYRAMAVRNLLIEMKMPKESINVSVVEGKDKANASNVMVR
ncbi:MAG: hypothetical protein RQ824_09895 [bacterium]|nr:hypothetical protein [bacterium]